MRGRAKNFIRVGQNFRMRHNFIIILNLAYIFMAMLPPGHNVAPPPTSVIVMFPVFNFGLFTSDLKLR